MIGGKAIAIIPDYKNDSTIALDGDFLKGVLKPGLTELVNQILPQVQLQLESVMQSAEVVFENINKLFDEETKTELKSGIKEFSLLTQNLSNTSRRVSDLIEKSAPGIELTINDLKDKYLVLDLNKDNFKEDTVLIKIKIKNPVTKLELLKSPDARRLGILIESIKVETLNL